VGHEKSPFAAIASMMTLNLVGPDIQPRHHRSDGREQLGCAPVHAPRLYPEPIDLPRSPPHPATKDNVADFVGVEDDHLR
jgi:hypothetical protein